MVHRILRGKCLTEINGYYESIYSYFHEIIFFPLFLIVYLANDS